MSDKQIWAVTPTLDALNASSANTLVEHLGINITRFGDDFLEATMPVDHRTKQPMGLLHGGANVVLAETLGSIASMLCIADHSSQMPVGLEINANHLRSVTGGQVTGRVTPIRVGRSVHVWQIDIRDDQGKLSCVSRLTISIVNRR